MCRYATFEPLHQLWQHYIKGALTGAQTSEERLLSADYHGACLKVIRSNNPIWIGLEGIVLKDSASAFHLISQLNRLHVVNKAGSTFACRIDNSCMFTLDGNALSAVSQ